MADQDFNIYTATGRDLDALMPISMSRDGRSDAEIRDVLIKDANARCLLIENISEELLPNYPYFPCSWETVIK